MTKRKSRVRKVPDDFFREVQRMAEKFDVPATQAFIIRDNILLGNFKAKKTKRRTKQIWEIEFYD